jgi:hypothetical protein
VTHLPQGNSLKLKMMSLDGKHSSVISTLRKSDTRFYNRLLNEVTYYRNDEEEQRQKVEKFTVDSAEEWDIKNAVSFTRNFG